MAHKWWAAIAAVGVVSLIGAQARADVVLLHETFDDVDFEGYGWGYERDFGVPVRVDLNSATLGGADNDWYAARFEQGEDGQPYQDVGAQSIGGSGNGTPVGIVEDDAGLLIGIDTTGYTNIQISFDWRTHQAESGDRLVFGYYIGDLAGVVPVSQYSSPTRSFDLRNAAHGGTDGDWNWNPQNQGGNEGDWIELLRGSPRTSFTTALFDLAGAEDGMVWLGFWLDNGEMDFGKIDNIIVTGIAVVPVPAALPLLLSGLAGLAGCGATRRRRA